MPTTIIKLIEQPTNKIAYSLTEKVVGTLLQAVFWWVPMGSPDYHKKLAEVAYWLIEVEEDTGQAEREIGFDACGKPILYAPSDRNMGLWTDSGRVFTEAQYEAADTQAFNLLWLALHNSTGPDTSA
ncbi:hypothetical protein QMK33_02855 [Hymenobacter sp. H14-R3]|uniref:hypothetical protein n=1 Tax=Hymenobacter sp. H14-R3 TaxID=3046308 RepID=UPI0024BA7F01|nr:hypothetical protein [Hymenobacter sp. H14-R3]MDJ0364078.1 hypothetical protein [Hymenobacter sp. H14-R3]